MFQEANVSGTVGLGMGSFSFDWLLATLAANSEDHDAMVSTNPPAGNNESGECLRGPIQTTRGGRTCLSQRECGASHCHLVNI